MFSVVIPLYNKAPYIEKTIQSVLSQTCQEFELIVIDDGSTDGSLEVVRQFNELSNQRINLIEQVNSGVAVARNNGVKVAKNEYIAFLDADDWWASTYLEEMKELILSCPEAAMYGCSFYIVKNEQSKAILNPFPESFELGYIDYLKVQPSGHYVRICTDTAILRKTAFNEVGGFRQLVSGQDLDMWLRMALKHKVAYLNKPLAFINQDVDSTLYRSMEVRLTFEHSFVGNLDYFAKDEKQNSDLKRFLDKNRVVLLFPYYLNKKYREAAKIELGKVDWKEFPKMSVIYKLPTWLLKLAFRIRNYIGPGLFDKLKLNA